MLEVKAELQVSAEAACLKLRQSYKLVQKQRTLLISIEQSRA